MTEPTDAELDVFRDAFDWEGWIDPKNAQRAFARAVLAKWGTPAVAGEPFAWADDGSLRSGATAKAYRVVTNETKRDMPKAAADSFNTPLYTTPQPTQAQAGAAPMPKFTALKFHARRDKKATVTLLFNDHETADAWVRGIKGGQHGTE